MTLTALERRVLGNLSIPSNPDYLVGRVNPFVTLGGEPVTAEQVDQLLRTGLSSQGWVVPMGEHDDPAALASKVQATKAAMDLPDDKAETYARRMLRPDLAWRMRGDLWMLSAEGLAKMHEVPDDAPPPMTPTQVQAVVDAEWARTLRGVTGDSYPDDPEHKDAVPLAGSLLEDEFLRWFAAVADDCQARWNVRPRGPVAGGASGWTDTFETKIIDHENQKTAMPALVAPWFMALSILAFTDADTGTTADNGSHVPTYTGWGRKSVAAADMPAATSGAGSSANTTAIIFAACTAGTSTILAAGNCDTVTTGELRKWFDVASTVISTTQTPAQFAVGAYTTTAA
jgi:hypothetical protein